MRYLALTIALGLITSLVQAFEIEDSIELGDVTSETLLKIISTTDARVFKPVLSAFLEENPDVAIQYVVTSSTELMRAIAEENAAFDIAISSAMDLQTKLANDGLTLPHASSATSALPDWARWRQDVFAFTQEPAALVVSKTAFNAENRPITRDTLIATLRSNPEMFTGKIGTYDVRSSGLGYLFATQDSRTSEAYWRLTEVMGSLETRLYRSSSSMIDDVANGKLTLAYNVLGSYALSRTDRDKFEVVFPNDFTTVMMRTALIPATAENREQAAVFMDFLLAAAWLQPRNESPLAALLLDQNADSNSIRRVQLGPGLLVFLDAYKKRRFISAWESSILQEKY